jgi:hypothetical protein
VSVNYNDPVSALRFVYLLGLVVWVGGLITLAAAVAPTTFEVLQARAPGTGRLLAGTIFGAVLGRFHLVAATCGLAMLACLVGMALVGPRPRPFAARVGVVGLMLAVTVVAAVPIASGIARLRHDAGEQPIAALPEQDPRRVSFNRLHGVSNVLLLVNVAGGLLLLWWEARS